MDRTIRTDFGISSSNVTARVDLVRSRSCLAKFWSVSRVPSKNIDFFRKKSHFSIVFDILAPRLLPNVHKTAKWVQNTRLGFVLLLRDTTTREPSTIRPCFVHQIHDFKGLNFSISWYFWPRFHRGWIANRRHSSEMQMIRIGSHRPSPSRGIHISAPPEPIWPVSRPASLRPSGPG